MKIIQENAQSAAAAIAQRLHAALKKYTKVVWLVSGGSNIPVEVEVMKKLHVTSGPLLDRLAIVAMDERYGEPGHPDSNFAQLKSAGFDPGAAAWIDVLARSQDFEKTIDHYDALMRTLLENADDVIGLFGMGADGHIAGLLPKSSALNDGGRMVVGAVSPDYDRLTMTVPALLRIKTAYMTAYGASKTAALTRLSARGGTITDTPGLLLYDIPEAYIYNDVITSEG